MSMTAVINVDGILFCGPDPYHMTERRSLGRVIKVESDGWKVIALTADGKLVNVGAREDQNFVIHQDTKCVDFCSSDFFVRLLMFDGSIRILMTYLDDNKIAMVTSETTYEIPDVIIKLFDMSYFSLQGIGFAAVAADGKIYFCQDDTTFKLEFDAGDDVKNILCTDRGIIIHLTDGRVFCKGNIEFFFGPDHEVPFSQEYQLLSRLNLVDISYNSCRSTHIMTLDTNGVILLRKYDIHNVLETLRIICSDLKDICCLQANRHGKHVVAVDMSGRISVINMDFTHKLVDNISDIVILSNSRAQHQRRYRNTKAASAAI